MPYIVVLQDNGKLYLSFDANFGLVQKKSSGTSFEPPKHGNSLFLDQDDVDKFVALYNNTDSKVMDGVSTVHTRL